MTLVKQSRTLRAAGRVGSVCGGLGAGALTAAQWFTANRTLAGHSGQKVNAALGHKHGNPEQGQGGHYLGARCCSRQPAAQECC